MTSSRLAVLGLIGIPAIFLPFETGVSAWGALELSLEYEEPGFLLMAAPSLLAIPIAITSLFVSLMGDVPRYARAGSYALAFVSACFTVAQIPYWLASNEMEADDMTTWVGFGLSVTLLVGGGSVLRRNRHREVSPSENAVTAMQVAYSAAMAFPLVVFFNDSGFLSTGWQIGAYLTLATVAVYTFRIGHLVHSTRAKPDRSYP